MSITRCATLALLFAFSSLAFSQYTAGKVTFKNPGTYSQADLEAVAQIHAKDKVSRDSLQAAAQRLIDTGYFDDVGATLEGMANSINVIFTLKPLTSEQMTAVGFENFVWLTPEERNAAIHQAAPLFHGRLPEAGNQPDAIAAALQTALAAKGVQANVTHVEYEPSINQPVHVIEYTVDRPSVRIRALKLRGVSPALAPAVQTVAQKLRNTPYDEGLARPTTEDWLLQPYLDAGYIEAKLTDVSHDIAETTPAVAGLNVSAAIEPGEVYHVGTITFAGTPVIPADTVMSQAKLHAGDIASHKLLLETLAPIDAAYRHLGYMDVFVDSGTKLDSASHTVSYTVSVTPGAQYHVHSVNVQGLSTTAQADFNRGWRMTERVLYDPAYVSGFLKNNTALRSLENYSCSYRASADPQTHLVDLSLNCFQASNGGK